MLEIMVIPSKSKTPPIRVVQKLKLQQRPTFGIRMAHEVQLQEPLPKAAQGKTMLKKEVNSQHTTRRGPEAF